MQDETKKVENGKEILQQIKSMQSQYETELADPVEEEMSFLDKLNKLTQLILNDDSFTVYNALDKESLEKWKKSRFTRWLRKSYHNVFYGVLLATITIFLVTEAIPFYSQDGVVTENTYLKAILTEVAFIFLSGYRTVGKLALAWVSFLRVGIFALMMFVISSQTLTVGRTNIGEIDAIQQQVELVERQVKEKDKEIVYYRDVKNWPITTKQMVQEKDKLVNKLISLKEAQSQGKNKGLSRLEEYKMYGRATFRVLLLLISVLISRRIFRF